MRGHCLFIFLHSPEKRELPYKAIVKLHHFCSKTWNAPSCIHTESCFHFLLAPHGHWRYVRPAPGNPWAGQKETNNFLIFVSPPSCFPLFFHVLLGNEVTGCGKMHRLGISSKSTLVSARAQRQGETNLSCIDFSLHIKALSVLIGIYVAGFMGFGGRLLPNYNFSLIKDVCLAAHSKVGEQPQRAWES